MRLKLKFSFCKTYWVPVLILSSNFKINLTLFGLVSHKSISKNIFGPADDGWNLRKKTWWGFISAIFDNFRVLYNLLLASPSGFLARNRVELNFLMKTLKKMQVHLKQFINIFLFQNMVLKLSNFHKTSILFRKAAPTHTFTFQWC